MNRTYGGLLAILVAIAVALAPHVGTAELRDPAAAVFLLVTMTRGSDRYHSVELGTAFFVRPDGTALTNSHVVYKAQHEPGRYQLLAIVGKEFYGVVIRCASLLTEAPAPGLAVNLVRDVAEIGLVPSRFPFTRLGVPGTDATYVAHLTGLPAFPVIELGQDPAPGETVRIIGFGQPPTTLPGGSVERWATTGVVIEVGSASDGTPVFRVASAMRPRPGNSGSPVLDAQGRAVGMWTWNQEASVAFGVAIGSSALLSPCKSSVNEGGHQ